MSDVQPDSGPNNSFAARRSLHAAYGMLFATLLFGFVPDVWCSVIALLAFTAAPILAGRATRQSSDAMTASHALYLRRTVWLSTVLTAGTMIVAAIYVAKYDDISPLQACADRLSGAANVNDSTAMQLVGPCVGPFVTANKGTLIMATLIAALPLLAYLLRRGIHGGLLLRQGLPVPEPRELF